MSSIEDILAQLDTEAMTRPEIRAVMSQIGKDSLLDAEMKRLGFWDPDKISGEEGKLFGSIGTRDITDALLAAGHEIEKSEVQLPGGALRTTGDFTISLSLGSDVNAEINLKVTGSDAPAETIAAMEEIEGKVEGVTEEDTQSESKESAPKDEE